MLRASVVTPREWADLLSRWPDDTAVLSSLYAGGARETSLLVVREGDDPVGYGVLQWGGPVSPAARVAHPTAVELNHLWVLEGGRGRGAGTALVGEAVRVATGRGFAQLLVGVGDDNDGARRLYERLGFVATGVWDTTRYTYRAADGSLQEAVETDEAMVLELDPARGEVYG